MLWSEEDSSAPSITYNNRMNFPRRKIKSSGFVDQISRIGGHWFDPIHSNFETKNQTKANVLSQRFLSKQLAAFKPKCNAYKFALTHSPDVSVQIEEYISHFGIYSETKWVHMSLDVLTPRQGILFIASHKNDFKLHILPLCLLSRMCLHANRVQTVDLHKVCGLSWIGFGYLLS